MLKTAWSSWDPQRGVFFFVEKLWQHKYPGNFEDFFFIYSVFIVDQQEIEKLRELNLQAEQEKVDAVTHVRNEAKTEIVTMRDKIQEVIEFFSILPWRKVIHAKQTLYFQWAEEACASG